MTDITTVPTETLYAELVKGLTLTEERLTELAAIWGELERRGKDLKTLRQGVGWIVAEIAAGKLLPAIVVKLSGQPTKIKAALAMGLEDQRKVCDGTLQLPTRNRVMTYNLGDNDDRERYQPRATSIEEQIAAAGSPRDAAEVLVRAVKGREDANIVAVHVLGMLRDVAEAPVKRNKAWAG
jgi:hypothetical protein